MNRDKQIEEMYKDVYEAIEHNSVIDVIHGGYIGVDTGGLTKELYDDGYRKASDVAREIFEEIEKTLRRNINPIAYEVMLARDITKLKKKYTEGE